MTPRCIAVTGAHGLVGRHLVRGLAERGFVVRAIVRRPGTAPGAAATHVVGDLRAPTGLETALQGVDVVVHAAGLAHGAGNDAEVDAVNRKATSALAMRSRDAGVARFLFLSSVRAQAGPSAQHTLDETATPAPVDAYGRSKLAAERELAGLDHDWAALRPVMIYGVGVGGNMGALLRLARSPLPLPFGAVHAPRSLLAVANLVDAVAVLAAAPGRLHGPFLVADGSPLDLPQMVRALRRGLGRRPGLVAVPPPMLRAALRAVGRGDVVERLVCPLVVATARLQSAGWQPRVASDAGLTALAQTAHLPAAALAEDRAR